MRRCGRMRRLEIWPHIPAYRASPYKNHAGPKRDNHSDASCRRGASCTFHRCKFRWDVHEARIPDRADEKLPGLFAPTPRECSPEWLSRAARLKSRLRQISGSPDGEQKRPILRNCFWPYEECRRGAKRGLELCRDNKKKMMSAHTLCPWAQS